MTIKPSNNFNEQIDFTIPNRITDTLFKEYFFKDHIVPNTKEEHEYLLSTINLQEGKEDLKDFIKSCEDYLGTRLSNQHLLHMTKNYLVGIIKTKLEQDPSLYVKDELSIMIPALGERFIDLYIKSNMSNQSYIFEFKYLSKAQYKPESNELKKLVKEARDQINSYKNATIFIDHKLYAYILIFVDCKCVHYERV